MAYKFQVGAATLSGSTKFEEVLDAAGGIKLSGVSAETAALNADSILFRDSDGTMKHESFADYGAALAGDGLASTNGVLAVGVDDSSIELNSDALRIKAAGVTDAMLNDDVATGLAGVGLGASSGVMALDLNELVAEQIASGDFLAFVDSTDNGTHKETVDDLATLFAGSGLSAASAVLAVNTDGAIRITSDKVAISGSIAGSGLNFSGSSADAVDSLSLDLSNLGAGAIQAGDTFAFKDANDSDKTKAESVDDLATLFAGVGLSATSAVMAVDLNELSAAAVDVSADSIAIIDDNDSSASKKESIADLMTAVAGNGIGASGGVLSMDASELAEAAVAHGDFIVIEDATDNSTKKEAVADLATLFAGDGLVAASSVLAVNPGKGLEINSDAVRVKLASSGGLTRGAGSGNDELALNMDTLAAATVDVGADSIAIIDGDDSDKTKKESIADLVTAMAGVGLTAASGVLNAGLDVALKADGNTLAVGMNYMADMTEDGEDTLTLPASAGLVVGDVIHVKAPSDCSSARSVKIARAGSQTIDGLNQVIIESPFGAVSMVYVAADTFRLI